MSTTYSFCLQGRGAWPALGRRGDGAAKSLTGPETVQLGRGAPRARCPRGAADPSPLPPPQVKELQHHCIIHDAWRGTRHRVQVRAREEFGHGSWSAWSPEAAGAPWTGTEWGLGGYPGLSKVSPNPVLKQQPLWREASLASPVLPVGPWRRVLLSCGHWDASGGGGGGGIAPQLGLLRESVAVFSEPQLLIFPIFKKMLKAGVPGWLSQLSDRLRLRS